MTRQRDANSTDAARNIPVPPMTIVCWYTVPDIAQIRPRKRRRFDRRAAPAAASYVCSPLKPGKEHHEHQVETFNRIGSDGSNRWPCKTLRSDIITGCRVGVAIGRMRDDFVGRIRHRCQKRDRRPHERQLSKVISASDRGFIAADEALIGRSRSDSDHYAHAARSNLRHIFT